MIPVIDVFAGPGGLNEGFARYNAGGTFSIEASFEMEANAVETLKLRSAVRSLSRDGNLYKGYVAALNLQDLGDVRRASDVLPNDSDFQSAIADAAEHVFMHELGESSRAESDALINARLNGTQDWVLIGGPPCQAYSLVGRSRRTGDAAFYADAKHTLYKEYLHIVEQFRPTVFVMENVKGLLSARTAKGDAGLSTFDLILQDMETLGYSVHSLVVAGLDLDASDFVIRAENYGVPQRRHRVILLGVRDDAGLGDPGVLSASKREVPVQRVLKDLPVIRSLVSRGDDESSWARARARAHAMVRASTETEPAPPGGIPPASASGYAARRPGSELLQWLRPPGLQRVTLHEPRSHMESDLERYGYLAMMASIGEFPRVTDLPAGLKPDHKNLAAKVVPFVDRFKVQVKDRPSSTIASHISKDGHYYIHYDFNQMRSLTVREAARLQTFPDDYFFVGNRTAQYHQVGNAVPPWLAKQIADVVAKLMGR